MVDEIICILIIFISSYFIIIKIKQSKIRFGRPSKYSGADLNKPHLTWNVITNVRFGWFFRKWQVDGDVTSCLRWQVDKSDKCKRKVTSWCDK